MKYTYLIIILLIFACNQTSTKGITTISKNQQYIIADLNGNSVLDSVFLDKKNEVNIYPKNSQLNLDISSNFKSLDWVDTLYLSNDSIIYYTTYSENGDVQGFDSVTNIRFPVLYLYSKEEGLGGKLINWNGKEYKSYSHSD